MAIITSMLDTDFYKFTMQQVVFKKFPDIEVEYEFKNRTKGTKLDYDKYNLKIQAEIFAISKLVFQNDELDYLESLNLFSSGYLNFLQQSRLRPVDVNVFDDNGNIGIKVKGTWLNTILWEVPLLAIISELYTEQNNIEGDGYYTSCCVGNLGRKIEILNNYNYRCSTGAINYPMGLTSLKYADFGTRRRYSKDIQNYVIKTLLDRITKNSLIGTSNVYLAKKYNVKPIGTMAHEYIQAMQALVRLKDSQKYAFQTWADVYRGNLGTALSDTLGMDTFYKDFDMYFSKLFDGARHDSGSPDVWCDKLIEHYISMNIDPMTKTAVFSDGLTFPEMIRLHKKYSSRIKVSFGIGTNLTNDCGIKPLQIVIKMTRCNGQPVAKISDSKGKQMCNDKEYLKYLATQFDIPKGRI